MTKRITDRPTRRGRHGNHARGAAHYKWNGGRQFDGRYTRLLSPGHPRADKNGRVREHILIAERALGKALPPKAVVHHDPETLVICQDQSYHMLLHKRMRAQARRVA